jgi:hypothetical protein
MLIRSIAMATPLIGSEQGLAHHKNKQGTDKTLSADRRDEGPLAFSLFKVGPLSNSGPALEKLIKKIIPPRLGVEP